MVVSRYNRIYVYTLDNQAEYIERRDWISVKLNPILKFYSTSRLLYQETLNKEEETRYSESSNYWEIRCEALGLLKPLA